MKELAIDFHELGSQAHRVTLLQVEHRLFGFVFQKQPLSFSNDSWLWND